MNGVLRFKSPPDFENPEGGLATMPTIMYAVTVQASDGGETTATEDVTIEVTNVDEPGTVTLSTLQPQVVWQIRATLDDPDSQIDEHHHLAVVPGQQPHHGRDQRRQLNH